MEKTIDLFVPGRLCLMGEHSDWAGGYRKINNNIEKGYAIVTGIEQGIYATVTKADKIIVEYKDNSIDPFSVEMNIDELKSIAIEGGFWSYVAGVAAIIKENYNVGGLKIIINKVTIPVKKGLSSSAAICVLVTRAFNLIYNLKLNVLGEMNIAYLGEIETPSRCGKLDQACAYGKKPILMTFDGDKIVTKEIKVGSDLFFVFADLMSKKDTIKILGDLNKSFPFATSDIEKNIQRGLGEINKKNVLNALDAIENGDLEKLGNIMKQAQSDFDTYVAPGCISELKGTKLHEIFNDKFVKENCLGFKGVGSQGDGTVQFLVKSKEMQEKLIEYLESSLMLNAYSLTIEKSLPVKKAIIPVAGNGTRMYPITKLIKKPFLPIIDNGIVKPAFMKLLEELDECGIEKIALVIDEDEKELFESFFKKITDSNIIEKLSNDMFNYDKKIYDIGKKITYIVQKEKRGLGHAVSLCEEFVGTDPVLLLLGDQLYKEYGPKNCTQQLIDSFSETNRVTVSVCEVSLNDVDKYGILTGKIMNIENRFSVDKMTEKPQCDIAQEELYTLNKNEKKYYAVFGEYILNSKVFELLKRNVEKNLTEKGEIQLTSVLNELCVQNELEAFIPNGKMYDIGTVKSYRDSFAELSKEN